jgi:nucleolar protein 15
MAAEDLKTKKRKGVYALPQLIYQVNLEPVGASDAAPKPKKQKKVDDTATTAPRKSARTAKVAAEPTDSPAAKVKPARKRAEDFFDNEDASAKTDTVQEKKAKKKTKTTSADGATDLAAVVVEVAEKPKKKTKKNQEPVVEAAVEVVAEAPKAKAKKGKKAKKSEDVQVPAVETEVVVPEEVSVTVDVKKPKKAKKSKKQEEAPVEEAPETVEEAAAEDEEDLDDQTAALLAGFESDRDESDLEKEDEDIDENNVPKLTKKQLKAIENVRKGSEPGVVFLGYFPPSHAI